MYAPARSRTVRKEGATCQWSHRLRIHPPGLVTDTMKPLVVHTQSTPCSLKDCAQGGSHSPVKPSLAIASTWPSHWHHAKVTLKARTCSLSDCAQGGSHTPVKPSLAIASTWPSSVCHQLCFEDSQLKACGRSACGLARVLMLLKSIPLQLVASPPVVL